MAEIIIRSDLNAAVMLKALDGKRAWVERNHLNPATAAFNRAADRWEAYTEKHGKAFEVLTRAEAAVAAAKVDRVAAAEAIETAGELTDPAAKAEALNAARELQADARRRFSVAAEAVAQLRAKLGNIETDFERFTAALWAKVDDAETELAQIDEITDTVLIKGDKVTVDDARRWYQLCGSLPGLTEDARKREAKKSGALIEDVDAINDEWLSEISAALPTAESAIPARPTRRERGVK